MTDPLITDLSRAERDGSTYRAIALRLAVRYATEDPEGARRLADRMEADHGEPGRHIAGVLREDATWSIERLSERPAA